MPTSCLGEGQGPEVQCPGFKPTGWTRYIWSNQVINFDNNTLMQSQLVMSDHDMSHMRPLRPAHYRRTIWDLAVLKRGLATILDCGECNQIIQTKTSGTLRHEYTQRPTTEVWGSPCEAAERRQEGDGGGQGCNRQDNLLDEKPRLPSGGHGICVRHRLRIVKNVFPILAHTYMYLHSQDGPTCRSMCAYSMCRLCACICIIFPFPLVCQSSRSLFCYPGRSSLNWSVSSIAWYMRTKASMRSRQESALLVPLIPARPGMHCI